MAEINTTTYTPAEIRAAGYQGQFLAIPVTVKSTQTLTAGTVLGIITASGLAVAYDDSAVDGSEVAAGILVEDVDAVAAGADVVSSMYVRGNFVASRLTGANQAAAADLGARTVPGRDLILL